ncbi:Rap1a/Tai family immunity protein [Stappia indica]|uniref:Rap1a/Tai family immunity protein n=1 Tax=Stappia indica TaxID=538381 RepID=UPI001D1871AF|nr:Rap1a/Tai family immunity protein [Stappia indica]MCC4244972.1 hypothetical protein [Stappia indica]
MAEGAGSALLRAALAGVVAVASGAAAGPAAANSWQSAQQIAAICKVESEVSPVAVTFCLGYLQGTLDAFLLGRANCVPQGVDANGLRRILLEHVARHPDRLAVSGPLLVYDAFAEAWPDCSHMPRLAASGPSASDTGR